MDFCILKQAGKGSSQYHKKFILTQAKFALFVNFVKTVIKVGNI